MEPKSKDALVRILELRAEGLSFEKIADRLNEEGIRNRAGGIFNRQKVRMWYLRHEKRASQASQDSHDAEPSQPFAMTERVTDDSQPSHGIAKSGEDKGGSQQSQPFASTEKQADSSQPSQPFAMTERVTDDSQPSQAVATPRETEADSQQSQPFATVDTPLRVPEFSQHSPSIAKPVSSDASQPSQPIATETGMASDSQPSQKVAHVDDASQLSHDVATKEEVSQSPQPSQTSIPCEWIAALRTLIREEIDLALAANIAKSANDLHPPVTPRAGRKLGGARKTMSGTRIDAVLFDLFEAEREQLGIGGSELMQRILWAHYGRPRLSFQQDEG
jgi:hypothetical protein